MSDPVIIPSFERELEDAKTRADIDAIAEITRRYEAERRKRAKNAKSDNDQSEQRSDKTTTPNDKDKR